MSQIILRKKGSNCGHMLSADVYCCCFCLLRSPGNGKQRKRSDTVNLFIHLIHDNHPCCWSCLVKNVCFKLFWSHGLEVHVNLEETLWRPFASLPSAAIVWRLPVNIGCRLVRAEKRSQFRPFEMKRIQTFLHSSPPQLGLLSHHCRTLY